MAATTGITSAPNMLPIGGYHLTKHMADITGVNLHPLQTSGALHFPVTFGQSRSAAPIARTPPLMSANFTGSAL
jgi:hypothetical protein